MERTYLICGLDALCRACTLDYFADGHRGAAIVSAWFFCAENAVGLGVPELVADMIDRHWANTSLCAPFPQEAPDPVLLDRLLETPGKSISRTTAPANRGDYHRSSNQRVFCRGMSASKRSVSRASVFWAGRSITVARRGRRKVRRPPRTP